jgi:hypothetical protein
LGLNNFSAQPGETIDHPPEILEGRLSCGRDPEKAAEVCAVTDLVGGDYAVIDSLPMDLAGKSGSASRRRW